MLGRDCVPNSTSKGNLYAAGRCACQITSLKYLSSLTGWQAHSLNSLVKNLSFVHLASLVATLHVHIGNNIIVGTLVWRMAPLITYEWIFLDFSCILDSENESINSVITEPKGSGNTRSWVWYHCFIWWSNMLHLEALIEVFDMFLII